MSVLQANGIDVHYRESGPAHTPSESGGPRVLLFVHALGTDLEIWDAVVAQLPADLRCIRYDLRGHGRTTPTDGAYSLALLTDDLLKFMDALGLACATLCGISIGGLIAQRAALDAPDRVEGLVLCDSAPRIGSAEGWQARIDAVRSRGLADMAGEITARWYAPDFCVREPAIYAERRARLADMSAAGYIGACHALRDGDLTAQVARISAPALVICGEYDVATPPAQSRDLARTLGTQAHLISKSGHLPCVEMPIAVAHLIESFLAEANVA